MAKQNEAAQEKRTKTNACYLYSKANYPVTIKYDGKDLVLPPYALDFMLADESKVGALPREVRKVIIREGN